MLVRTMCLEMLLQEDILISSSDRLKEGCLNVEDEDEESKTNFTCQSDNDGCSYTICCTASATCLHH